MSREILNRTKTPGVHQTISDYNDLSGCLVKINVTQLLCVFPKYTLSHPLFLPALCKQINNMHGFHREVVLVDISLLMHQAG